MSAPFSISFNVPWQAAIDQAQSRGVLLPEAYYALPDALKWQAQTISGMTRLDQIQRVMDAMTARLTDGGTFAQFKKEADSFNYGLNKNQLDLVFRNAVQNAYQAGHWRNFEANKASRGYLMYSSINDGRTRPAHRALSGMIRPVDDVSWATHSPPCGHRCRCTLISLTEAQARDRSPIGAGLNKPIEGLSADKGWGYKPTQQGARLSQMEAEKLSKANAGIVKAYSAQKAKHLNSGQLWDVKGALDDCLTQMLLFAAPDTAPTCLKANPSQPTWEDLKLPDLRALKSSHSVATPALLQAGQDANDALRILREAIGIKQGESILIQSPVRKIEIADWTLNHIVEKRMDTRERYANLIRPTLEHPLEIWSTEYEDGFRERYIKLFDAKKNLFVVVRVNQDGSLLWNIMQKELSALNSMRMGNLVFKVY